MSNLVLQCKDTGNFNPHPEGIWPALCLDVIELGMMWSEFQGQRKLVPKVKVVFETEAVGEDGKRCIVTKNFTASLHPKAKLAEFLGKWRGRPVVPPESVDLGKLIGACCTLVISHQKNLSGKTYASVDAISKPTKSVVASGAYDPVAMRQRIAEWVAKQAAPAGNDGQGARGENKEGQVPGVRGQVSGAGTQSGNVAGGAAALPKSGAASPPPPADFDPEVGF
jgi:hypothetical protein